MKLSPYVAFWLYQHLDDISRGVVPANKPGYVTVGNQEWEITQVAVYNDGAVYRLKAHMWDVNEAYPEPGSIKWYEQEYEYEDIMRGILIDHMSDYDREAVTKNRKPTQPRKVHVYESDW